ncbi:MAG: formylglycine-generating enzyme family protein [Tahibacter sp.]
MKRTTRPQRFGRLFAELAVLLLLATTTTAADYRALPAGTFNSVLPPDGKVASAKVDAFAMRSVPVTNEEFLAFVQANPQWRRDRVAAVFADPRYLARWSSPLEAGPDARPHQPVTEVSWFAARAYCASEKARLPQWHEWEYAAAADTDRADARGDARWRERILSWYARPSTEPLAEVGSEANFYGLRDLHGLVWEWVDDVSALMVGGDNREQGDPDLLRFCGAGALSLKQTENFAVLMRIAMLSSLKAADTTRNLGFRCVRDIHPLQETHRAE